MGEKVAVYREEHFNAAHRLNNAAWSAEQNKLIFGKCNLPNYHGHNYVIIVKVVGEVDPDTGYVIDMKVLSDLIAENILDKFDHKTLNLDVPAPVFVIRFCGRGQGNLAEPNQHALACNGIDGVWRLLGWVEFGGLELDDVGHRDA